VITNQSTNEDIHLSRQGIKNALIHGIKPQKVAVLSARAALFPARRASQIEPIVALNQKTPFEITLARGADKHPPAGLKPFGCIPVGCIP
jgi:hypothetical protein